MRAPTSAVVVLAAVAAMLSTPVHAAETARPRLVVRIYPLASVGALDWRMAAREASAIFAATGIDLDWLTCQAHTAPAACDRVLQRDEVAVRIVRAAVVPVGGRAPLGESLVDAAHGSATLATIHLDRVEALAHAGGVPVGILLARAIAHELGHLLLGTNAHSPSGLMRPVWTRGELVRAAPRDWLIPPDDGTRMRLAYGRRLEPSAASGRTVGTH